MQNIEAVGLDQRIRECVEACGSIASCSRKSGVAETTIRAYTRGKSEPTVSKLLAVARAAERNPHWLLTGLGPKRVIDLPPEVIPSDSDRSLRPVSGVAVVSKEIDEDTVSQQISHLVLAFSEQWLSDAGLSDEELYLQMARGDAMAPTISEGDTMLISGLYRTIEDGSRQPGIQPDESFQEEGIYSVKVHSRKPEIRRLQPDPEGGFLLSADNVNRPDIRVSADKLKIIGRVEWIGRRL